MCFSKKSWSSLEHIKITYTNISKCNLQVMYNEYLQGLQLGQSIEVAFFQLQSFIVAQIPAKKRDVNTVKSPEFASTREKNGRAGGRARFGRESSSHAGPCHLWPAGPDLSQTHPPTQQGQPQHYRRPRTPARSALFLSLPPPHVRQREIC